MANFFLFVYNQTFKIFLYRRFTYRYMRDAEVSVGCVQLPYISITSLIQPKNLLFVISDCFCVIQDYDSLIINNNWSYRLNSKTCHIFKQIYFSSTVSDCCKYLKWFPLVSKFIATNTYRSYLTTYNNRLKWYLKTDLNTLEAQDDTIIMVALSLIHIWRCRRRG